MSAANGKRRPLDRRPCNSGCGMDVIIAKRMPLYAGGPAVWRALNADEVTDDRRSFAYVLVGTQAWRRVDLVEHWHVSQEISEEAARLLVDDYPHHLLHTHHTDDDGDDT